MSYEALLFDLDDTLIDFTTTEDLALTKVWTHFLAHHVEEFHCKKTFHTINRSLWSLVAQGKKRPEEVKIERFTHLISDLKLPLSGLELAQKYESCLCEQVIWFDGVQACLNKLATRYKLGVITNGLTFVQEKKFELGKMGEWCQCFVISETVGVSKPNQKIFDIAFKQLGIDAHQTLMIGDSLESDYQGARNTGMDFCWINAKNTPLPAEVPQPKYILKSVSDLLSCLHVQT